MEARGRGGVGRVLVPVVVQETSLVGQLVLLLWVVDFSRCDRRGSAPSVWGPEVVAAAPVVVSVVSVGDDLHYGRGSAGPGLGSRASSAATTTPHTTPEPLGPLAAARRDTSASAPVVARRATPLRRDRPSPFDPTQGAWFGGAAVSPPVCRVTMGACLMGTPTGLRLMSSTR